ncbi:hypothetical protein XSR1_530012 [Xenorhabdus szentirmaii DSM 16338]|uniref:Uncharacterized protein n=1 Tax=Xenorhabdus szentirmaii DSM 16338 TaxID=1427518 RepID=W1J263_9GAMM|nr:hypothetical protein XSR1_530012 [Xenorhabdus szentirmaii DSM 16338]
MLPLFQFWNDFIRDGAYDMLNGSLFPLRYIIYFSAVKPTSMKENFYYC